MRCAYEIKTIAATHCRRLVRQKRRYQDLCVYTPGETAAIVVVEMSFGLLAHGPKLKCAVYYRVYHTVRHAEEEYGRLEIVAQLQWHKKKTHTDIERSHSDEHLFSLARIIMVLWLRKNKILEYIIGLFRRNALYLIFKLISKQMIDIRILFNYAKRDWNDTWHLNVLCERENKISHFCERYIKRCSGAAPAIDAFRVYNWPASITPQFQISIMQCSTQCFLPVYRGPWT